MTEPAQPGENSAAGSAQPAAAAVPISDRNNDANYRAPRANLQISDFDIVGRLGDGSFSTVILAKLRHGDDEHFAIKVVNKHLVLRNRMADYIRNERNILDQLSYDGIVRLRFTFQDSDSLYFGCEYCPGGDLYEQITKKGKLSLDVARFYTAEVVLMLEYLRSKQVVHRDLKPENLLLTANGHLKLTDFGSARAFFLPPAGGTGKQARATSFVGTAEYVSPEVLNNTPLSYPADLWALGSVVFQMLTGKPPFKAASEYLTFQKVAEREFEFPPDFPPVARDLVDALLQVDPQARLGARDMGELKTHAFFEGVQWETLRQQEAPPHVPPPGPTPELEGLDWEVTSIIRDAMGGQVRYHPATGPLDATAGTGVVVDAASTQAPAGAGPGGRAGEGGEGGRQGGGEGAGGEGDGGPGRGGAGVGGPAGAGGDWLRPPTSHVVYVRNPEAGESDGDSDG